MAITPRAVGAWAASNATTQTVTLPTHVAGDMLIVRTIRKPFTNPNDTVINTTGWNAVATGVANGSTANGNGTGSMGFKAFYKIAESAAETNPVVTWGTTSAPGAAVAVTYQKASTEAWVTPAGNGGGDATARTSQTSTIASHISVVAGDLVDFFRGQCDDSGALTVPTITQTGVTYDTVTEYPATALLSGTSNDIAADGGYRTATAGPSSAAAVVTGTSAASEEHGAWMTRLRVNQAITVGLIDASGGAGGSPYVDAVTADSPIAYYRMGEASGSVIDDAGSADGTTTGTVTRDATGLIHASQDDGAISFAASAYVSGTLGAALPNVCSFEAWVKLPASGTTFLTVFSTKGGISNVSFGVDRTGGVFQFRAFIYDGSSYEIVARSNTGIFVAGGTYHVVWTRAGSSDTNQKVYINGADQTNATGLAVRTFTGSDTTFWIAGFEGTTETWVETIDELAIYNTVLSGATVDAHYDAGLEAAGAASNLYAPTVVQSGAQGITLGLLDGAPALYAPTVIPDQFVTMGLLDGAPALYAPTITTVTGLTVPQLDAANALYAPTVTAGGVTVTLPQLDAGPVLYAPTFAVGAVGLTLPQLDAGPALYAPALTTAATVTLGLIDASKAVYAPTLTVGAVGITLGLLDSGSALYAPTVARAASISYIAPTGNDSTGDGSIGSPWLTLRKFYAQAEPGDVLYCRGGTYSSQTKTTVDGDSGTDGSPAGYVYGVSGTSGNPITIAAYPGETPVFVGNNDSANHWLAFTQGASYMVVDGITANNFNCNGNAIIWIGNTPDTVDTHHIEIRNCHLTARVSGTASPHGIYLSARSADVLIEHNVLIGDYPNSNWGAGIEAFHTPGTQDFVARFNVLENWKWALQISDADVTGEFYHNTCLGSDIHIYADAFDTLLIEDCVGDTPVQVPFYPIGDESNLTGWGGSWASVNCYWDQTFNAGYDLAAGQSGRGAASDGSDSGAIQGLILGLIDASKAVYAPTVTAGSLGLTLPQLDAANAVYAPTVTAGAVTLTVPLLTSTSALYAPTLTTGNTLTVPFLDSSPALHAPTITTGAVGVTLGLIDSSPAVYAPALTTGAVGVTLGLLDSGSALYAPEVIPDQFVTLGQIDAGPAVYAPTMATSGGLALTLIDSGSALYAPDVIVDQFVTVPLLDAARALYAPTLTVGAVSVSLGQIDATRALYAPTLATRNAVSLDQIDANRAVYAPTLANLAPYLVLPLLDGGRSLYPPSLGAGAVGLVVGDLDAGRAVYAPELHAYNVLAPDLIDAGAALYAPLVEGGIGPLSQDIVVGVVMDPIAGVLVGVDGAPASVVLDPILEVTVS